MRFTTPSLLLVLVLSCHAEDLPRVSIHFLKNPDLTLRDIIETPLTKLELDPTPWIDHGNIDFFDASSKCLYLKKPVAQFPARLSVRGKPFILVVGGEPKALAAVWSLASSYLPEPGVPTLSSPSFSGDGSILQFSTLERDNADPNAKKPTVRTTIAQALDKTGLVRKGIALTLDDVSSATDKVQSPVTYSFTIKNEDKEALLVFDPNAAGMARFHYFCNGVILVRMNKDRAVHNSDMKALFDSQLPPVQRGEFALDWFLLLKPGEEMKRTIKLAGYKPIPEGSYKAIFDFSAPIHLRREQLDQPAGRVWFGSTRAEKNNPAREI